MKPLIVLALACCGATSAFAATRTVTSTANSGSGSLRNIISNAVAGDTIVFDESVFAAENVTIRLTSGAITIDKAIFISGLRNTSGALKITVTGDKDSSGGPTSGDSQVFVVSTGGVTIQALNFANSGAVATGGAIALSGSGATATTITECGFANNASTVYGGAIFTTSSYPVTVSFCTFQGNSATISGGAISTSNIPSLAVASCTFTGNQSTSANSSGGAISTGGTLLSISDSLFSGNASTLSGGAIRADSGIVTIIRSTLTGNSSDSGGGLYIYDGSGGENTIFIENTTFSGNTSVGGGSAFYATGTQACSVTHCTITGNTCNRLGATGIAAALQTRYDSSIDLTASIVAGNFDSRAAGTPTPDIARDSGSIASYGGNVFGNLSGTDAAVASASDRAGTPTAPVDPGLLPLANNGGGTPTHATHPLSIATDLVTSRRSDTDQRNESRPYGSPSDSGSFERNVSTYDYWVVGALPTYPVADRDHADDPDHDGIPNAIEYLQGTDPALPSTSSQTLINEGENRFFTFSIKNDATLTGLNARVGESIDLSNWTYRNLTGLAAAAYQGQSGSLSHFRIPIDTTGKPKSFIRLLAGQ